VVQPHVESGFARTGAVFTLHTGVFNRPTIDADVSGPSPAVFPFFDLLCLCHVFPLKDRGAKPPRVLRTRLEVFGPDPLERVQLVAARPAPNLNPVPVLVLVEDDAVPVKRVGVGTADGDLRSHVAPVLRVEVVSTQVI
jgi:hypothetical protein